MDLSAESVNAPSPASHFEVHAEVASQTKLTLWADSKLIKSPIAIDVDPQGRVWATEDEGALVVLSDNDGNGQADKRQEFIREPFLRTAMSLAVFDNKIFVGNAPQVIVYTDVNRNSVFDEGDTREVFLKGFAGHNHDHAIHSFVGAPSGQLFFNYGNMGATFTTVDGREISSASYYGNQKNIGKKSFDGRIYVGGLTLRLNPDGSKMEVYNSNTRNVGDMGISSYGDVFQADNDDPAHARVSWCLEYGNYGYADLSNGGIRSWAELAKSWDHQNLKKKGTYSHIKKQYTGHHKIEYNLAHWKEAHPSTAPIGYLLGAGSPIGQFFMEGTELGEGFQGKFIIADCVRRQFLMFNPQLHQAQYEMGNPSPLLKQKDQFIKEPFFPVDVTAGTDGSLFFADWVSNNYSRGWGIKEEGAIYRLSRKNENKVVLPQLDFSSTLGLLQALKSPAVNVRWLAVQKLIQKGRVVTKDLIEFFKTEKNPYHKARAVWILAQIDIEGRDFVVGLASNEIPELRITAFRSLRHADSKNLLKYIEVFIKDSSLALKREILLSLRDRSINEVKAVLPQLVSEYDGKNKYYLEAIGSACDGHEKEIYKSVIRPHIGDKKYRDWSLRDVNFAWRFFVSEDASNDLLKVLSSQKIEISEFRRLLNGFSIYPNDEIRLRNKNYLKELKNEEILKEEVYQSSIDELILKDLTFLAVTKLNSTIKVPSFVSNGQAISEPAAIAKLSGDQERGRQKAVVCTMCHSISGSGSTFGPDLTNWGQVRSIEAIVKEIARPSDFLAHGYDKNVRYTSKDGKHTIEGIEAGFYYHEGTLRIKAFGGKVFKFAFRRDQIKREQIKHSWMPTPDKLGLNDQDVRDIAEYLKNLGVGKKKPSSELKPGQGSWKPLFPKDDFKGWKSNQQWKKDYQFSKNWSLDNGQLNCTGQPIGLLYSEKSYKNFELKFEWKHHKNAGNSGLFVWIKKVGGVLAEGIEVQVLDPGYEAYYKKVHTDAGYPRWKGEKKWFTGHGDVFPVGAVKMTPFLPSAPEPRERFRSFPIENRTKPHGEWNHYHIKAVNGVIRLSVNGKEVSGGYDISPSYGPLAFESEGSSVSFRNIMIKELPDNAEDNGSLQKSDKVDK